MKITCMGEESDPAEVMKARNTEIGLRSEDGVHSSTKSDRRAENRETTNKSTKGWTRTKATEFSEAGWWPWNARQTISQSFSRPHRRLESIEKR